LGELTGQWVPHDTRDTIVDFVRSWSDKTDIAVGRFLPWIGIGTSKFYDWKDRFARSTSTTPGCHATTGSPTTRKNAFASSLGPIRSMAIGG